MSSKSLVDRILGILLYPFDMTPEGFLRRLGVIPTIIGSIFVRQTYRLYDYIGTQPGLGHFLNVGWWEDPDEDWTPPDTFDMTDRCQALVRKVADRANLNADSNLLDVGFGYGEQDRIFLDEYDCGRITGINITLSQVQTARERLLDRFDGDRICFNLGDAVQLPYPENTFNTIIALESPFHFHTRKQFLKEARRVLEKGGRLIMTDIINGYPQGEAPLPQRIFSIVHNVYWQVNAENHSTSEQYRRRLNELNFENVEVQDITENTLVPGITRYLRWRVLQQASILRFFAYPFVKWALSFYRSKYLRYVIASAKKPDRELG